MLAKESYEVELGLLLNHRHVPSIPFVNEHRNAYGTIDLMVSKRNINPKLKVIVWILGIIITVCIGYAGYRLVQGNNTASSHYSSGIEGTVSYGPLCPTEPCSVKPAYDFDIIAVEENGNEAARTRPNEEGKYKLDLPPGRYEIKASRSFASELGSPPHMVQIEANKPTHLDLSFDTGIR